MPASFRTSRNFYLSDWAARQYWKSFFSIDLQNYLNAHLEWIGEMAATVMDTLSLQADKYGPVLKRRNFYGEDIFEIEFHPAYWQLMSIAVRSEMFRIKWHPTLRQRFVRERHLAGFAPYFIYTMAEGGIPCPLCMTDGAARLIDKFCEPDVAERLLPHVYTDQPEQFYTGAMFLTEKSGGSDVGANIVRAVRKEADIYLLEGEKWFCSNANAQMIFALARTDTQKPGTRGLSLFLIEPVLRDGRRNPMELLRLKDKLGVRSMASAEIFLRNTQAQRIGNEGEGFKLMAEMVNLSRLYNAVAAVAFARRALIEAYQFACYRHTFGKPLLNHTLFNDKMAELAARYHAIFSITWRAIRALDAADNANEQEAELARLLIPMVKRYTAIEAVYIVREAMEAMGGIGYIEDGVMPKLMRDVLVLPIWEGAGNIMILDMMRAAVKSKGLAVVQAAIQQMHTDMSAWEKEQLANITTLLPESLRHNDERMAKYCFERLTQLVALFSLRDALGQIGHAPWLSLSIEYLQAHWQQQLPMKLDTKQLHELIAWHF